LSNVLEKSALLEYRGGKTREHKIDPVAVTEIDLVGRFTRFYTITHENAHMVRMSIIQQSIS